MQEAAARKLLPQMRGEGAKMVEVPYSPRWCRDWEWPIVGWDPAVELTASDMAKLADAFRGTPPLQLSTSRSGISAAL